MTIGERVIIEQLEKANVVEFADLLAAPSFEEERVLRLHLGDDQFQRLQTLSVGRREVTSSGNVVIIPGIMGSELTATDRTGNRDRLWLDPLDLLRGRLERLRLADNGRQEFSPDYDVRPSGIMKRFYGEILLALSARWTVRAFCYDWRKDLKLAADALGAQMTAWFGEEEPVHLIGHSMGGLVARTFVANHRDRWNRMWDEGKTDARGGRLIMLGTPNHGSFGVPQVITGLDSIVGNLALADLTHSKWEVQQVLNSFVGMYQMLPSPLLIPKAERLYDAHNYGGMAVLQRHLDRARDHHLRLQTAVDPTRMIFIGGSNRPTIAGIGDYDQLGEDGSFEYGWNGDGRITYELGALESNGDSVPCYYVDESHAQLPQNDLVLAALDGLLRKGEPGALPDTLPRGTGESADDARQAITNSREQENEQVVQLVERITRRYSVAARGHRIRRQDRQDSSTGESPLEGIDLKPDGFVGADERELAFRLVGDFLSVDEGRRARVLAEQREPPPRIDVDLWFRSIHDLHDVPTSQLPVDAIAVGHYIGVRPQAAELALDKSISSALHGEGNADESDLILTEFTDRGTLSGELGRFFFMQDLRKDAGTVPGGRVIAIAGMGLPGRFGTPELSVLAGELCWALGTMHKQHLATVLIGTGRGNIPVSDAVRA